jgi:hypothetical protein
MLYDTAEPNVGLDGVMLAGGTTMGGVDLALRLQLSNGILGPRFLGGGVSAGLKLEIDEEFLIGIDLETTYLDQFTWVDGIRSPTLWAGAAVPFVFRFSDVAWVWIKPALGVALSAHLFTVGDATIPRLGFAVPGFRLSYGASIQVIENVHFFGESSTTVPFGGGYLALGSMVEF